MAFSSVNELLALYESRGSAMYGGEPVTQLAHALQCAHLAEQAGEPPETIVAALLHDVGHMVMETGHESDPAKDDLHQYLALPFLRSLFQPASETAVLEPIRLHVDAKRYLCWAEPAYWAALSPASKASLELQGGRFDDVQAAAFIALPHVATAVRLRRYDDWAKVPGLGTPGIGHFAELLHALSR